jgi:hypothetical protein
MAASVGLCPVQALRPSADKVDVVHKTNRCARQILLALLVTPAAAEGQDIAVQLLFDGKPLQTTAPPQFTCRDDNRVVWIGCKIAPEPGTDGYVMARPEPGTYTLHVEIDENQDNPARFPGDYDVFQQFEVTADMPVVLQVDVLKLMRITFPWDNNNNLDGMLTLPWSEKPVIETLRRARTHTATVTFKWESVAPAAEYNYVVYAVRAAPFERGAGVFRGTTRDTRVTLTLPLSAPGRYFAFELSARRNGRRVGEVFTHDAGVQGWASEFIVRDWSGRSNMAPTIPIPNDAFLDEWKQTIPQPAWWDDVPPSALAINSLGDLLSVWQSDISDTASRQRFYKLVYQAILDHPGDEHLVATGVALLPYAADSDDRFPLLKFAVDHFFSYNQRTDNCANCKIGDQTGQMVRDLADAYISRGEFEAAIQIIQRLVDERESDVSAYNLALTFETLSRAYWEMEDADAAKAAIKEGLRRFPDGWQADQLRRTLERYEKGR